MGMSLNLRELGDSESGATTERFFQGQDENSMKCSAASDVWGTENHISRRAHAKVLETTENERPCNKGKESAKKFSLKLVKKVLPKKTRTTMIKRKQRKASNKVTTPMKVVDIFF